MKVAVSVIRFCSRAALREYMGHAIGWTGRKDGESAAD